MLSATFCLIATLCAGTFFGAAVYISLVQHPAAFNAGGVVPGRFFSPMYRRAAPMQASLAVIGSLAAVIASFMAAGWLWLVAGLVFIAVVPFTLICIKPVNDRLKEPARDPEAVETLELLRQWSHLHWVRSVLGGVALLLFVGQLAYG